MRLLERDPELETAADLYAAATAPDGGRHRSVASGRPEDAPLQGRAGTLPRPHGQSAACDFASMAGWRLEELLLSA